MARITPARIDDREIFGNCLVRGITVVGSHVGGSSWWVPRTAMQKLRRSASALVIEATTNRTGSIIYYFAHFQT